MTAPEVKLLPCPFCGWGKPDVQHMDGCYNVDCPDCCAAGPIEDTRAEAIAAWNTRTTAQADSATAPLEARIAALEGALGEAEKAGSALLTEMMGPLVGGGDGNTYVPRFPSAATHNRLAKALASLRAMLADDGEK